MKLWIAGKVTGDGWEFQGVFASEDAAARACKDETYFIAPAWLNEPISDDSQSWPGAYYPKVVTYDKTRRNYQFEL
jgi:hypothetical protein